MPILWILLISAGALAAPSQGYFIENGGQWDSRAQFLLKTGGLNLWITGEGPVFDFRRFVPIGKPDNTKFHRQPGFLKGHVVRMSFSNARHSAVCGKDEQPGRFNYFVGDDPTRWAANVRGFGELSAEQPYDGISVRYSLDSGTPRYDVIVRPGADPTQVGLKIEGADGVRVKDNGNLAISTSIGEVEERGLTAYQESGGRRTQIPCRMILQGDTLSFDLGAYDAAKPLILDPLIYSSYLGGSGGKYLGDRAYKVVLDSQNNSCIVGAASSTDFPVTTGAYQTTNQSGNTAFVAKLNSTESGLVYATYLGGSAEDQANSVCLDSDGDAYVAGFTWSKDFPVTKGAFQTKNTSVDSSNGFVTKLNPSGSALLYSTFLGGSGGDGGGDLCNAIALDSKDDAFVTGGTSSSNFPVTSDVFQTENKGPGMTGFVTELNPTGTSLVYSSYLGGSSGGEQGYAIALEGEEATVAGETYSSDFPVTSTAYQKTNLGFASGERTGFLSTVNATGTELLYSSFFGGSGGDQISDLAFDSDGNATFVGITGSPDLPITSGAYQPDYPEIPAGESGFAARLDAAKTGLIFSTFLGGSGGLDEALAVALDKTDDAVIVGQTNSPDFPVTSGAFETVNAGTMGFVTELKSTGKTLNYSTLLGGFFGGESLLAGPSDTCYSVALNSLGYAVMAGTTNDTDFPTTAGAFEPNMPSVPGNVSMPPSGFVTTLSMVAGATRLVAVSVSPDSIVGGNTAAGSVSLTSSTTENLAVTLASTGPVSLPSSVSVLPGTATASFQVVTQGVDSETLASITATSGSAMQRVTLKIDPAQVSSLSSSQTEILGGATMAAAIGLSGEAGPSGVSVSLSSSDPDAASVPATVKIPSRATAVPFLIKTTASPSNAAVTITAATGSVSQTLMITVRGSSRLATLTLDPASQVGDYDSDGIVRLQSPAAAATSVAISSSSPLVTAPSTITVPAGSGAASFSLPTKAVSSATPVYVTATLNDVSQTASLTLYPGISSFTIDPASVAGGQSSDGVVRIPIAAGSAGYVVSVSANSADVTVPASVKVTSGNTAVSLPISTKAVTKTTVVTITVKLAGSAVSETLTLTP